MEDGIESLCKNVTWRLVDLPSGRKFVKHKWVFKIERKPDGSIDRYKAKLVAKGLSQKEGLDYTDTYAPVAKFDSISTILTVVVGNDYDMCQFDIKTAFLHVDLSE